MNLAAWSKITYFAFLVFLGYFLFLALNYLLLGIFGMLESEKRKQEEDEENYAQDYFSTFVIPVSIIMPACNEEDWIRDSVPSVLNLDYPSFELIIVDDGSTDNTFKVLNEILDLKPTDMVYIRHYKDGKTNEILVSRKYPNVLVVRKDKGHKKAGAVNAGLNIAKYDYVCVVDADTVLEQDSFLKVMAQVQKDPERVVGIGSYFGLVNGFKIKKGVILEKSFSYRPIVAYQNLEYIRSFFGNRVGWSKFNAMPNVAGGFGVWRKDILYELGGYSAQFSSEDIEFTFRVHKYIADNKKPYRIVMLPYYVCWTEGPTNIRSLVSQRDRWQRVVIETTWKYKSMLFNPRYGSFAFITFPYHLFFEVLGVFVEAFSILFVVAGWIFHVIDLKTFLAFFLLMLVAQGIFSLISILSFVRSKKIFSNSYVLYLVFLSFFEFFWYRWIISIGKVTGTYHYLRQVKVFDQYAREKRT